MENETKVIEEQKAKKKMPIIPIFLLLLSIGLIVCGILLSSAEETPETSTQDEETQEVEQQVSNIKSIELTKETEELVVDDNLKIKFIGTASPDIENSYTYKAEIYLNNELITDNFFTGTNIWSSNFAATFDVTKVENTYIIKSFIAKQCNGSYVLVLSTDKTFTSYNDVSLEINEELKQFTVSQCSDCMNTTSCTNETVNVPKLTN